MVASLLEQFPALGVVNLIQGYQCLQQLIDIPVFAGDNFLQFRQCSLAIQVTKDLDSQQTFLRNWMF